MAYLRELNGRCEGPHTNKGQRTSIGANQFASPIFLASTLPARESRYFREFLNETDPDKRASILQVASPEMSRALSAQWALQQSRIAEAEGRDPGSIGEGGRLYSKPWSSNTSLRRPDSTTETGSVSARSPTSLRAQGSLFPTKTPRLSTRLWITPGLSVLPDLKHSRAGARWLRLTLSSELCFWAALPQAGRL